MLLHIHLLNQHIKLRSKSVLDRYQHIYLLLDHKVQGMLLHMNGSHHFFLKIQHKLPRMPLDHHQHKGQLDNLNKCFSNSLQLDLYRSYKCCYVYKQVHMFLRPQDLDTNLQFDKIKNIFWLDLYLDLQIIQHQSMKRGIYQYKFLYFHFHKQTMGLGKMLHMIQ